jgi:hypothetical protein
MMHGDCWVDQVATQGPEPGKDAVLVGSGKPRIANDICD